MNVVRIVVMLTLGFLVQVVHAQTTSPPSPPYVRFDIYRNNVGVCTGGLSRTLYQTSGQNSTLSLGFCEQYITVSVVGNADIGRISLSGGPGNAVGDIEVVFATSTLQQTIPSYGTQPPFVGGTFGGISSSTMRPVALYAGFGGDLTGTVSVSKIHHLRSNGAINYSVTASDNVFVPGYIEARKGISGNISVGGFQLTRVLALNGDITGSISCATDVEEVRADNGSITSSITANNGKIRLVSAPNGRISGNIVASAVSGQAYINSVVAGTGIGPATGTSTISANFVNRVDAGSGPIRSNITASSVVTVAGQDLWQFNGSSFTGSLNVSSVRLATGQTGNAINITGSTDATIAIRDTLLSPVFLGGGISGGSITLGSVATTVTIQGTLGVPLTIASTASGSAVNINALPSAGLVRITGNHAGALNFGSSTVKGLDGQVVINAGNGTGTWSGVVRVNGSTPGTLLSPVLNYSNLAGALGADADGGGVGVGPGLGEA